MPNNVRDNLRQKLLEVYNKDGKEYMIVLTNKLLASTVHKNDKNFKALTHGEIAETLLEILILDYIKRNNINNWIIKRGLILKDATNPNSDFLTELDLTLFTPSTIVLFECKSYGGTIEVFKKGAVYREGKQIADVFNQNLVHKNALNTNVEIASKGKPNYKIAYFHFALGTIKDKRDDKYKKLMPIVKLKNLDKFLDNIKNSEKDNWNMKKISRILDIICKNNDKRINAHLNYVKSKHK